MAPAEDQEIVLPWASVMVIMVLLNEAFTCATPETMFLRSRRRTRVASLAIQVGPSNAPVMPGAREFRFRRDRARPGHRIQIGAPYLAADPRGRPGDDLG